MPSVVAPGRSRPITRSQAEMGWRRIDVSPLISGSCWSGIQRSGGSPRSVSPKNPGGVTPTTVNGCPFDDERGADDRRIAAVGALPHVVAQHDGRRRRRRVVGGGENAAAECADAERREVVAGDELGTQRPRRRIDVLAPYADARAASLKCRELFEFRQLAPSAARTAERRTFPSDPAGRPARSRRRRRRCGRAATDRRPAASAA